MYLKLIIDGATSQPFSADTLPLTNCAQSNKNDVIHHSREVYSNQRAEVEKEIFTKHLSEQGQNSLFT
jgi:hypothetical protein